MSLERTGQPACVTVLVFHSAKALPLVALLALLTVVSCAHDSLQGRLVLSGSATLAPLVVNSVEQWKKEHANVEVSIESIGSDAGLERLIRYSDADLALVSRPLAPADVEAAKQAGKTLVPLPLAWDAVCLVVPASNTWARSLSRSQAQLAFTTAVLWSDLDSAWPAVPIHRFVLGPNSGTADVFAESLFADGRKEPLFSAREAQSSEDDRILARGIAQIDGALGYLGWSTFTQSNHALRVVAFEGVAPTSSNIADHRYGLPRQLWLVATVQSLSAKPAARSLLSFLYEHYSALTKPTGLVPLTDSERVAAERTLDQLQVP